MTADFSISVTAATVTVTIATTIAAASAYHIRVVCNSMDCYNGTGVGSGIGTTSGRITLLPLPGSRRRQQSEESRSYAVRACRDGHA